MQNNKILQFFTENNIDFINHTHEAYFTVEQSKQDNSEYKNTYTHTKNLFIHSKKWEFAMVTMIADKKLDSKTFRKDTWFGDFSFANSDNLWTQIQITPGSVWIFGLINNPNIKLYIDQDIRNSNAIWRHPNDNTATTVINHDWLQKYLQLLNINYQIINIQ